MMALRPLPLEMQEHVLHGDPAIVASVLQSCGLDAAGRLAIHASGYSLRLTESLRESFPALVQAMGPAAFNSMAVAYIDAQPSAHASIRWFGALLADHLQACSSDIFADIARW